MAEPIASEAISTNADLVSLVVPTYNEIENIVQLLTVAHEALATLPHEILVVDDNSPDGTGAVVERFAKEHPWVRLHRRATARGLSSAVIAGFSLARGNILGVMDADLSHDEA